MEVELNKYSQKRDDLRIPVEMWDRSAWSYEGERESGALNVLQEIMLRWWRQKLTREFSQVLRPSLGSSNRVVSSQGIREVAGEYAWIEGARYSYLQDRREIQNNNYWEDGVDCLERAMGSSWWEW